MLFLSEAGIRLRKEMSKTRIRSRLIPLSGCLMSG